jgi:ABC-2 type transport system ATP-binding protein
MIQAERLTKRYGRQAAVNNVSFTVGHGEIVGLLGPNGAGKSTILRILACFLPASAGTARVAGFDVFRESEAVRRRIGYMPENNPLHPDMRVHEYLRFRARLKGLGMSESRAQVELVTQQCGLTEVSRKMIGTLSKGFRQRVGLADALVHQPQLIILDEPTIGLDPHQIRAVRQLIRELGRERTILLSSHMLPEVEMTCQRVLILHRGRILAADTTENLQRLMSGAGQVVAEIAAPAEALQACWEQVEEIEHYDVAPADGEYFRCALTPRAGVDLRPRTFELVRANGWRLRELTRSRHSLEDIFVHMTRADRDEEGS